MLAASIFTRLHRAEFYQRMHRDAADLLPMGQGKTWLDLGCGPGVLARIAAAKGYAVRAIDADPAMIAAAKGWPLPGTQIDFAVSNIVSELNAGKRYEVVSASSLLVVLADPIAGLAMLQQIVKPQGQVLVIEASEQMGRRKAFEIYWKDKLGKGGAMLLPWAFARSGRALPDQFFAQTMRPWRKKSLLSGMANAWLMNPAHDQSNPHN